MTKPSLDAPRKVELLSPAGDPQKLKIAIAFGADAVYGGVSHFSLRTRSSKEFTIETFGSGVEYAHSKGKKVFVTVNGFPFNNQLKLFENHLAQMRDLVPDAFIVSSPGAVRLAKKIAPNMPLHLSTQANALNLLDAEAYFDMGVSRVIAAREMSLRDLEAIKTALPALELEVFVHGSMCFAYSGRCLISSLQSGRVANRGSCANDCRFPYRVYAENEETGALMRIEESESGSYIFNAKDLNLASHLEAIVKSGAVDSVKIEGRTKSAYYCACATRAYRLALDDIAAGRFEAAKYEAELATLKNRGYTDGFLVRRPYEKLDAQNLSTSQSEGASEVAAIVDGGGKTFHLLGIVGIDAPLEVLAPIEASGMNSSLGAIAGEKIVNELGEIWRENDRIFIKFFKLVTANGKELQAVHSGNENAVLLPAPLPEFSFLRRPIAPPFI